MNFIKSIGFLLFWFCFIIIPAEGATNGKPRYIFLFIGDGMGHTAVELAEIYARETGNTSFFPFSSFPSVGYVKTHCFESLITDSAAAGTAIASGEKTRSGRIGLDADGERILPSITEKAGKKKYKIGIITTNSLNDATPAAFYAHQLSRKMKDEIAWDAIQADIQFWGGGGFEVSSPLRDSIYREMEKQGCKLIHGKEFMKKEHFGAKSLFVMESALRGGPQLTWRIDREGEEWITLEDMVGYAVSFFTHGVEHPFFIMAEGGKIDWAAHANDPGTLLGEMFDFNDAIRKALDFYELHPDETLIVITSDHETGGLSLGNRHMQYQTNLSVIGSQKISGNRLGKLLAGIEKDRQQAREVLRQQFGFWDTVPLTSGEENQLFDYFDHTDFTGQALYDESETNVVNYVKQLISLKSGLGWTTMQHTGNVVPVYAMGVGAEYFNGVLDNTEIHDILLRIINEDTK